MNTLNTFPELLTFWLLAPFILRVVAGSIFTYFGYTKIFKEKERRISFFHKIGFGNGILLFWIISLSEIILGSLLIVGIFTQITVIILSIIAIYSIYITIKQPELLDNSLEFFVLLFAVLISLIFLGAGFWAIDLPL